MVTITSLTKYPDSSSENRPILYPRIAGARGDRNLPEFCRHLRCARHGSPQLSATNLGIVPRQGVHHGR